MHRYDYVNRRRQKKVCSSSPAFNILRRHFRNHEVKMTKKYRPLSMVFLHNIECGTSEEPTDQRGGGGGGIVRVFLYKVLD